MYRDFFGISSSPFEDRADTKFFFATPDNEEVLASMEYETRHGSGVLLVLGEPGTGKTLLARAFLGRIPVTDHAIVITCPTSGEIDFLRETCKGFGVSLPTSQDQTRRLNRLRRHLNRFQRTGKRGIVIVDQAENLSAANLWELASLLDLYGDSRRLVSIVILAAPTIRKHLERPEFTRLRQHLFGQRTLHALSAEQTPKYVTHRIRVAGAAEPNVFDSDALKRIHEMTGGIPRLINRICNASMVAAYADQKRRISRETVEESTGQPASQSHSAVERDAAVATLENTERDGAGLAACANEIDEFDFDTSFSSAEKLEEVSEIAAPTIANVTDTEPRVSKLKETSSSEERLDRALARAERMSQTTEASIDKAAAIEKHLVSLLDRAERVADSLRTSAQSNADALIRAEKRVETLLGNVQQKGAAVQNVLTRASSMASDGHSLFERLQASRSAAEKVESRLTTQTKEFADHADDVQSQVARLVGAVSSARESADHLEETTARFETVIRDHEKKAESLYDSTSRTLHDTVKQLVVQLKTQTDAVIHDAAAAAKQIEERLTTTVESARTAINEVRDKESQFLLSTLQSHRESAKEIDSRVQSQLQSAREEIQAIESGATRRTQSLREEIQNLIAESEKSFSSNLDETIRSHRQSLRELEDAASGRIETLTETTKSIDDRISTLNDKSEVITRRMFQAGADAERLSDKTTVVEQRIQDRRLEIATLEGPLHEALKQAESSLDALRTLTLQAQTMHQQAASTLIDVGMAWERIRNTREEIRQIESSANGLTVRLAEAGAKANALAEGVNSAERSIEQLTACNQTARTLANASTAANEKLEGLVSRAGEEGTRLSTQIIPARQLAEDLRDAIQSGQTLSEVLEKDAHDAAAQAGAIETRHALAADVLTRLTEVSLTAKSELGRFRTLEFSFSTMSNEAIAKLERLVQLGNELITRQEPQAAAAARAAEIFEELQTMIEPTRRLIVELNEHTEHGRLQHERLERILTQSNRASEQLSAVSRLLVDSRETSEAVRKAADHAQSVHDSTQSLVEQASKTVGDLRETIGAADTASARHVDFITRIASVERALDERISAAETGDKVLTEFLSQMQFLTRSLQEARQQAAEVETKIDELTTRPTTILESAKAQSLELEKVCSAVRKVFAGLSQAGLDAHQKLNDLRYLNSEAAELVRQLRIEGGRWNPPSREFDQSLKSGSRKGLVENIETPACRTTDGDFQSQPDRPLTGRAKEIARLLEEAKRAEAESATAMQKQLADAVTI